MDDMILQNQFEAHHTGQSSWNLDEMVDQVSRTLHEEVDPLTIRLALANILVNYEDVPIKTFVPIFACREAEEALKKKHGIRL
jgi:hypothetical protein